MTPREQRRARATNLKSPASVYDWPHLPEAKLLEMPYDEKVKLLPKQPSITAEVVNFLRGGDHE